MTAGLWVLLVAVAVMATSNPAEAQLTYASGQVVSPAYEGWEVEEDGSLYFLFGYMNSNWEEEPVVPIGSENYIKVLGDSASADTDEYDATVADQGQPTRFQPRRNRFVFRVPVPEGFDENDEIIWRLTTNGETETAYATLGFDYKVDNMVQASEQGALGAGQSDPTVRANLVPELRVEGPAERTVRVGEPLELVAIASDDGVPRTTEPRCYETQFGEPGPPGTPCGWSKPRQITVGSAKGLRVSWYLYRGAGWPTFEPEQAKTWEDTRTHANSPWAVYWAPPPVPEDGRFVTEVTFDEPGTYVLRCLASDGAIGADSDVTITVTQ